MSDAEPAQREEVAQSQTEAADLTDNPNPISNAQIQIPENKVNEISTWLQNEILQAEADRSELDDKILEWQRIYEALPETETRDFPWEGASNIVVPVAATSVDAVFARMMNSLFGGKELWIATARSPNWQELTKPISKFLNWVGDEVVDMYNVCQRWILGMIKYGTGVSKTYWDRRIRNVVYRDQSGAEVHEPVVHYDGPRMSVVPLKDFLVSADAVTTQDIQYCTWVGDKSRYTWKELKELEASDVFKNVDRIRQHGRAAVSEHEAETQEYTGHEVTDPQDYELYEIWCSYDLSTDESGEGGDGILSELVVTMEKESGIIVRAVYNFFKHQERPYHILRYMPREDSIYGIGMCKMLENIQEEITSMHRHRLDNATIANTRAWKKRKGTTLGSDEIFPGAFIEVDEIDDISELQLGDIYQSLLVEEQHTNAIGEKRTGVSDYTMGRESSAVGSGATATSTLALIREGNKRFSMTIRDMRKALSNVAHQFVMLYQQFAPNNEVMYEMFSEQDKRYIQQYFQLPPENTRQGVYIDTPALSETNNKEIVQQTMLTLMQITQQYFGGMFQAVQMAVSQQAPPEVQELAKQGAKTGSEIFKRLLEAFDFTDADNYIVDVESLLTMGSHLEMQQGMMNGNQGPSQQPAEGGLAGSPVQGQQSSMGGSPQGNGAGTPNIEQVMAGLGGA